MHGPSRDSFLQSLLGDSIRVLFRLIQYPYLAIPGGFASFEKALFHTPVELGACPFDAQTCKSVLYAMALFCRGS